MATSKKFFHDHWVLLLLSINAFLSLAASVYMLTSILNDRTTTYLVQCRDCSSGAFDEVVLGGPAGLLSLIVLAVIVMVVNTVLAKRTYRLRRSFSLTILWLGTLLLVLNFLVIYSLISSQN